MKIIISTKSAIPFLAKCYLQKTVQQKFSAIKYPLILSKHSTLTKLTLVKIFFPVPSSCWYWVS